MNRYFRKVSTGEWLNAVMGGSALDVPTESHIADLASALEIPEADLEVVDSDDDPRSGKLLSLPVPPPDPIQEAKRRLADLDLAVFQGSPLGSVVHDILRTLGFKEG